VKISSSEENRMRRPLIAIVSTIVGLVALLGFKSSGGLKASHQSVSLGPTAAPSRTSPAPTSGSATTAPTTAPAAAAAPTTPPTTAVPANQTYTGSDIPFNFGDIQVAVTIKGGKIANIAIPQENSRDPRSASIDSQAVPILTQEALQAQGVNINAVSGATYTSDAFAQALQSALGNAGR
jgi:uncharacterized protein with FMN-binding domain